MFSVELRVTFPLLLTISIDSCCWDLINLLMKTFLSPGEISCWSSSFWPVKSLSLAGEILNSCGLTSYFPTFSDIFSWNMTTSFWPNPWKIPPHFWLKDREGHRLPGPWRHPSAGETPGECLALEAGRVDVYFVMSMFFLFKPINIYIYIDKMGYLYDG